MPLGQERLISLESSAGSVLFAHGLFGRPAFASDEVAARLVPDPALFGRLTQKDGDMADDSKRQEANGKFAKLQRTQTAQRATAEYEIEAAALRAKTERLRALRLERDGVAPKPAPGAPKQKSKKRGGSGSLSAFLDGQAKEGRNG
jgi:hypothetical protein